LKKVEGRRPGWMAISREILPGLPEFCKDSPYQVKKIAIRDACRSYSNEKKKAKKTGRRFSQKFKSRKDPRQSCYIPKSSVTDFGVYPRIAGKLRYSEQLPDNAQDSRLVRYNGRYYLTVPREKEITRAENQGRVVAIDPGVRSFITFYSETNLGQLGTHDIGRIQRLCEHLDDLMSRMSHAGSRKKRRMQRAANRMRWKIRDLVDELHHKAARFLVDNFDIILLPTFETQKMAVKNARKLRKKSVRQMLTWAHYRFKEFLKNKAFEMGKAVMDVCEAYTSKTNSWTGELMPNLGGREWIAVDGFRINRDINGARGILLRALVDSPALKACVVSES
jgi:putative transposase